MTSHTSVLNLSIPKNILYAAYFMVSVKPLTTARPTEQTSCKLTQHQLECLPPQLQQHSPTMVDTPEQEVPVYQSGDTCPGGLEQIEPPCVKADVNKHVLEREPTSQDDFAQAVLNEHGQQSPANNTNEVSLMDDLEETLQLFLKEVMGQDPEKTQATSTKKGSFPEVAQFQAPQQSVPRSVVSPPNLQLFLKDVMGEQDPENALRQQPQPGGAHFIAPQHRAPRSASRYPSSYNEGVLTSITRPGYTVTEWLKTDSPRSQPLSGGHSVMSSLTVGRSSNSSGIGRGKKRALSSSPLSTDGIDLNAVIRTSPTSLVAYINGSHSASLSPAFCKYTMPLGILSIYVCDTCQWS